MATNAAFRKFLQDQVVGLNAETAREVEDVHGINAMKRLADLTRAGVKDLANLIRKQRMLNVAPLPDKDCLCRSAAPPSCFAFPTWPVVARLRGRRRPAGSGVFSVD